MNSSQEIQKKVRFDNNSIKYKYDVEGIIDNSTYAIQKIQASLKQAKSNPSYKQKSSPSHSKFQNHNNFSLKF